MSKSRYINTKFWSDTYVDTLDPSEKLLFLYLLTNERTTISGAYELPLKIMAVETGFDKNMIEKIIKRFVSDDKMIHQDGWIVMLNSHKHQNLKNSKIVSGIQREFNELPLKIRVKLQELMSHTSVIDETSHFNLTLTKPNLTKPNTKNPIKETINFDKFWEIYPRKTSKSKSKEKWEKLKVDSQLFEEIKKAIAAQSNSKQWQDKNFIPHAVTWLNQERWEDEVEIISNNVDVY